ncbi:MAG: glutaminyl-peptide cyclotransferase, partial [Bacteroidota bacterium]
MKHHQIKKTVVYSLLCILFIAVMFQACKNDTVHNDIQLNDTLHKDSSQTVAAGTFEIFSPVNDALYAIGEKVLFHIEPSGNTNPDSIVIMSGKKRICVITETPWQYEWTAEGLPMGRQQLKAESWEGGKKTGHKSLYIRLKSDIVPKDYTCKIINKYQHGVTDYTQGLVFENGFMYEGTGQLGRSSLKKYRV